MTQWTHNDIELVRKYCWFATIQFQKPERRVEGNIPARVQVAISRFSQVLVRWGGGWKGWRKSSVIWSKKRGGRAPPHSASWNENTIFTEHTREREISNLHVLLSVAKPSRIYRRTFGEQSHHIYSSVFLSLFIQFVCYFAPRLA